MADPVIGATVQVALEKLLSLAIEEVSSLRNCKNDLRVLKENVSIIQDFVHDHAERQQLESRRSMEGWLTRLEKVAEDAEYVFDEFRYESIKRQVNVPNNPIKKVRDFFSHIAFKRKLSQKINNIKKELTEINQLATNLGLQSLSGPSRSILPMRGETDSTVVALEVVGRDKDVAEIMEKMLNLREDVVLFTIPIVGMGGLGKTTVAKKIFNDKDIMQRFEKRVWLCLPEMSDSTIFLKKILESLTEAKVEELSRDVIVKKLRDKLGGNKYLLVLDDLWVVDRTSWDGFVDTLKGISTSKGNCIIVTTRNNPVPSTVATDCHMLGKLADDQCWSIFKQKAFVDGEVPEEFESMEKMIVKICQGLPLAASALGGLLRKKEKHEWLEILEANPFAAGKDDTGENLKKILKLSYDHLPSPHLKKCFAYFAMFQKDVEFEKDQLIQLWMAEGFLCPCQETPMMEEVGNNYFQLLLKNSLLQDAKLDAHNNITHCKMHDVVHDLTVNIFKSKLFDPNFVGGENHSQFRYFGWDSPSDQIDNIHEPIHLRTLFLRRDISSHLLLSFQFLRVLNLSKSDIKELPASIGKLIYLRYLDLSRTGIRTLPNSICKLYNLQTFRAIDSKLEKLPDEMRNMVSLRHIYYDDYIFSSSDTGGAWQYIRNLSFQMPLQMGKLTCLQTLPFFKVGLEKGRQIEELGFLKNLGGELAIKGLQLVANMEEARTACLHEKPNIYKLAYMWSHDDGSEGSETNDGYVLEGLQPHRNLKTFSIEGYLGTRFPSWFSEVMLPNLVKLKLSYCKKCIQCPSLGQLKLLRHLELVGFHKLEIIGPSFYGVEVNNNGSSSSNANIHVFPSLKELVLEDMPSLIEWREVQSKSIGNGGRDGVRVRRFPSLEKLTIKKCPLLESTPNQFEVLHELSIEGVASEKPLLNLCSNLTSLVELKVKGVKELTCLPNEMLRNNFTLQRLRIGNCENFRELRPSLYDLHSLKSLSISDCPNFRSFPVPSGQNHLTSLLKFEISDCGGLTSLPSGMLDHCRSLEFLIVSRCDNLVSFPLHFGEMPSLLCINISQCPKLNSVPTGGLHGLTGLISLSIGPFSESVDFDTFQSIFNGIQQLSSFCILWVYGSEKWDSLPSQLMQLSALTILAINGFGIKALDFLDDALPKLQELWILDCPLLEAISDGLRNLVSLEKLFISRCRKLQHLPSRDAMLRLTKLRYLDITHCHPELEESCRNGSGPSSQWSNISHIPEIRVNRITLQDLR